MLAVHQPSPNSLHKQCTHGLYLCLIWAQGSHNYLPTATCSSTCGMHGAFPRLHGGVQQDRMHPHQEGLHENQKHAMLMFIDAGSRTNGTRVCSIHELAVEENQVLHYSCMRLKIHAESPGVLPQSFTLCHCLQSPCVSSLLLSRSVLFLLKILACSRKALFLSQPPVIIRV